MNTIANYPGYSKSDPRFYPSGNKKPGLPLVFFIHFYGGHQKVLKRHINLVNGLGYDAFCFNMPNFKQIEGSLWINGEYGMKHLYADMIRFYLTQISGPKIIFSFSNPSASAIEIMSEYFKRGDGANITGFICDSGPSLAFIRSAWNLGVIVQKQPWLFTLFSFSWSWKFHLDLPSQLSYFPKDFPILSIRGEKDSVIPPWHIEKVFANSHLSNLQVLSLPEAGHLDGLKNFPEIYQEKITSWLKHIESK